MGRSKFPGKPSKHILRKRINVLPPAKETTNVETNGPVTVDSVENKQEEDIKENGESIATQNVNKKISIKRRLNRKMKSSLIIPNSNPRNLISRLCNKTVKTKINKATRTTLSHKAVHSYSTTCRSKSSREATNLVGKFVLPTRSVHSSRVIKPNKRFISDLSENITLKKKVSIVKRQCMKQEEDKSKVKAKPIEDGSYNDDSDKTTFTNGHRVVLRQARLKLPNQIGTQGPFSRPNNSSSGTVTCGVCGAVRFYRFVKQARKFNIYSCESCRKFIAKMIKRLACGNQNSQTILVCNKGQGTCHVSPIVRSQQWKLTKCSYRARCPACWLKMCLRSFQMPPSLKQSLSLMLPKYMQSLNVAFNNTPPLLWQANVEAKLLETPLDKPQETTMVKQRPVRFKNPKPQTIASSPSHNSDIRRQKIDLKGPRVKHVCRSASIVLGQPIATFTEGDKKCDTQNQSVTYLKSADDKVVSDKNLVESKCTVYNKSDSPYSEPESSSDKLSKLPCVVNDSLESSSKRDRSCKNLLVSSLNCSEPKVSDTKKNLEETQSGICIDFWDGYNVDNICQNGYCLIGSQQFPMVSVCFLCGSAGKEPMVYCSLCCEPYHTFCLDESVPLGKDQKQTWVCPKCVNCNECNQNDRQKVSCQKCLKAYHPECFNSKSNNDDKSVVCSKCSKCKTCQSQINKYVGNRPLCMSCFKLQQQEAVCPLCRCSIENETILKIMECTKCIKWVHAKCEKLTEEQYQMLCLLSEFVQYSCSSCNNNNSNSSGPYWKKIVYSELKSRFNRVLRLLSRNKVARNVLKLNPTNSNVVGRAIPNVRKLQFTEDLDFDNNNYGRDLTDINKIYSFEENEKYESLSTRFSSTPSVIDIRNRINSNNYRSVKKFYRDLQEYLRSLKSEPVLKIYQNIFDEVFPWYKSLKEELKQSEIVSIEETLYSDLCEDNPCVEVVFSTSDCRMCSLCKNLGDSDPTKESRLLYCGQNEWVHANCAYWSTEVHEEVDGSFQNVQNALMKGRLTRCSHCKQKGASIGCCYKGCHETYHFSCARTVKLNFLYDKTVYCSNHEISRKNDIITEDIEFLIHRPVYVELEKRRRKLVEIDKVNFVSGSLCVKKLGKIEPFVSDQIDVIVPMGFICTRLFWSMIEPWKLVPYTIVTSLQNSINYTLVVDRNFTIDHTLGKTEVDKIMKEFCAWQKDLDKKTSDVESEDDEEQQNGTELLSPELTDAILEELPHDLLDGISVQDIFPKFSYDDLISIDYKNEINNIENISENYKKPDIEEDIDQEFKVRDMKRNSKPDIFSTNKIEVLQKSRTSQKTCSLAINCKIDSSLSPVMKKRKMTTARENNMIYQLLQVDGNADDSSSECGSPLGQAETDTWGNYVSEEPVTCEKCQCTYRTQASYKRHLDSCEILCTSESDSEMVSDQDIVTSYVSPTNNDTDGQIAEPVVISSYESYQSEIHTSVLNTQSFVASKSTELLSTPQTTEVILQQPLQQTVDQKSILQTLPVNTVANVTVEATNGDQTFNINPPTITIGGDASISIPTNQPQFCVNQTVPLCVNQPITLQPNNIQVNPTTNYAGNQILSINPSGSISINPINQTNSITVDQLTQQPVQQPMDFHQTHSVTIQSVPINNAILNVGTQNLSLNGKLIANPVIQAVNVPGTHWVKQVNKPTIVAQKATKSRARSRTIAAKRPQIEDGDTIILPAQNSTGQLIVQQIPSTNYVPTFVDNFQQSGQNLQYVATIAPQPVSTQPIVQIQPENNIISIVPGLQQTMYIQQPRVLENHLVVDSNGQIGWSQQQTVQPVYYGFETIVQNTVMQSQQFLPTTMPGVLTANSSYSTTTQVFQTSKLEPVLDVPPNSFVLVNPSQIVNSQPLINSQQIVNQPSLVTSQPLVNTQPIITSQTLVNPQPLVNSQQIINTQPIVNSQPQQFEIRQISQSQPVSIVNNTMTQSQGNFKMPQMEITKTMPLPQPKIEIKPSQSFIDFKPAQQRFEPVQPNFEVKVKTVFPQFEVKPARHHLDIKPSKLPSQLEMKSSLPQRMNHSNLASASQKPGTTSSNSITLPTAPFVSEQRIPTNIVTPIPKPTTQSRPMSRVLPMPTTNILKETKKILSSEDDKAFIIDKLKKPMPVIHNEDIKPPLVSVLKPPPVIKSEPKKVGILETKLQPVLTPPIKEVQTVKEAIKEEVFNMFESLPKAQKVNLVKLEKLPPKEPLIQKPVEISIPEDSKLDTSLKLIFQKQGEDGTYKISNNFIAKQPVQVVPLKPIKSLSFTQNTDLLNSVSPPITGKQEQEVKVEENVEKPSSDVPKPVVKKENDNSSVFYTIETQGGFKYSSSSVSDLWSKVIDAVQNARKAHNMPPLPINNGSVMTSLHVLGLKSNGLKYLVEQLPGATKCSKYKSLFDFPPHPSEIDDELTQDHSFGTIRCSPYKNKNTEPYDMFGWLSSKHRQPEEISLDTLELLPRRVVNLPMAMKFRQLKLTSKYSVGVYRSCIHGRGLFCLRDIEAGEMVIEYAGEVIRSILTDKREKYYNSKGIGCYMFRVDDNFVVDATMKGNAARFINHSCDPNCYSRVVEILGHKHIIIFALRRILSGEELTYDYKFPFEEDKIPCTCGSRKCRKFLN